MNKDIVTLPQHISIPENAAYCRHNKFLEYDFYDKYGNILLEYIDKHNDNYDSPNIYYKYEYNADGTVASKTQEYALGISTILYTYNPDKTILTEKEQDWNYYIKYEYDKYGNVVREYNVDERYDECTLEIEYENIYENGKLILQREKETNMLSMEKSYEYDENGNVSREIIKSQYMNELVTDTKFTYYSDGRIKSKNIHYPDNIDVYSEYVYISLI